MTVRLPAFFSLGLVACAAAGSLAGCAAGPGITSTDALDRTPDAGLTSHVGDPAVALLSAFYGLDNTLPRRANLICRGAAGLDGMPVIFSTEVDPDTVQAGDFEVITTAGDRGNVHCVSFMPATDAGELRTVLLVGEFGGADTDPPAQVRVTGNILSLDGEVNFKGTAVDATPLVAGPSIVLAEQVTDFDQSASRSRRRTKGTTCPVDGVEQAVRVVWAGGVTLPGGEEPGQDIGALYQVTVESGDGARRVITPTFLADLGDGDNNHLLCLDTSDMPVSVAFPAGLLTDPNEDLNPATSQDVVPAP